MSFIQNEPNATLWHEELDELMEVARHAFTDDVKLPDNLHESVFGCDGVCNCDRECPAKRNGKLPWAYYEVDTCTEAAVMDILAEAYVKGLRRGARGCCGYGEYE